MPKGDFDLMFDSILSSVRPPRSSSDLAPGSRASGTKLVEDESERKIRGAMALFHRGEYARCRSLLEDLEATQDQDPRVMAFLGASRALTFGQMRVGMEACVAALRRAFYIPELYCALGVVLLRAGNRSKAYAAFQRGLRIDARHPALTARVREMGVRRSPILKFLSRSHPANRFLGILRARLLPS